MFHTPPHKVALSAFSPNRAKHDPGYDAVGGFNHRRCDVLVDFMQGPNTHWADYIEVIDASMGDCLDALEWLPEGSTFRSIYQDDEGNTKHFHCGIWHRDWL